MGRLAGGVAHDFNAAIEIARTHPGPIDLLLSDVVMPELRGDELGHRLADRRPS